MTKDNMTIRFTPDGFSYIENPSEASASLDEAQHHEVAPGPDFQVRLQEEILNALPECDTLRDLTIQCVTTRVILLPPGITDIETASLMYRTTLAESAEEEKILLQPLTLPTGQEVMLCFGINRSLYNFLQRNYGELTFEHHLAELLVKGSSQAKGNCLTVWCSRQFLEVAHYSDQRLMLANIYRSSQAENCTFYVMNTWTQEGMNQLQDNLLILGQGDEGQQIRNNLQQFIKNIYS